MDGSGATHWFGYFEKSLQNVLRRAWAIGEEQVVVVESGLGEAWGYVKIELN